MRDGYKKKAVLVHRTPREAKTMYIQVMVCKGLIEVIESSGKKVSEDANGGVL